jgi:bacteriocin biosynthesis cyclodehydratase domain-containing protein
MFDALFFKKRPRFALPYTILADSEKVRLIAGEDFRYTFESRHEPLTPWFPELLKAMDGRRSLEELIAPLELEVALYPKIFQLFERLYRERIVVEGESVLPPQVKSYRVEFEGLAAFSWASEPSVGAVSEPLRILCQETLDYEALLRFNGEILASGHLGMWMSYGALSRAYISPVFGLKEAPCLACLWNAFRQRSPFPELYQELLEAKQQGKLLTPVTLKAEVLSVLQEVLRWKVQQLKYSEAPAALYRLHVIEIFSMEIRTYRVFRDPLCPACHSTTILSKI